MKIRSAFLAIAAVLFAAQASAAEKIRFSAEFDRCVKAAGAVDPAVMECQSKEWERQDKRLNLAYQKLLAKLPAAKKAELRDVQRAWLAYAQAKCKFYYDDGEFNGTLNRQTAQYCAVEERALRAAELEDIAQW